MGERRRKSLTRRQLLKGSAALGAAAAVVSILPGCTHSAGTSDGDPVIVESEDATSVLAEYSEKDLPISEGATYDLPAGSVLHSTGGSWMPVVATGDTANPMVVAKSFSPSSGLLVTTVAEPITQGTNWVIYDARCSDLIYAWVELDALSRDWKLMAQGHEGGTLTGKPTTLWEGDADYDPPLMCVAGNRVLWQVMPSLSGNMTSSSSFCYLWKLGESEATAVVESPGRFATPPNVSGGLVILSPRVNADAGMYYGITAYDLGDDLETIVDRLVLPQSIRPFRATRIGEEFVFSVEANYQSGGLFGNMGYYIGHGDGPFITVAREPSAEVSGNGQGLYVVKSRSSYFVVDTEDLSYSILGATNNCTDYGEYPATSGEVGTFVTFATVKDNDTGSPSHVHVRTYVLPYVEPEPEPTDDEGEGESEGEGEGEGE